MSKNVFIAILTAIIVIALGWMLFFRQTPKMPEITPSIEEVIPPVSNIIEEPKTSDRQQQDIRNIRTISVPLSALNNSGESGIATLTETIDQNNNKQTIVKLNLSGAPEGVTQPAHIHAGECPGIGAIVYPLTSPVNGKSETSLNVTIDQIIAQLPLAINVHKSTAEVGIYVSCGNIIDPQAAAATSDNSSLIPTTTVSTDDNTGEGGSFSTPTDRRRGADNPED